MEIKVKREGGATRIALIGGALLPAELESCFAEIARIAGRPGVGAGIVLDLSGISALDVEGLSRIERACAELAAGMCVAIRLSELPSRFYGVAAGLDHTIPIFSRAREALSDLGGGDGEEEPWPKSEGLFEEGIRKRYRSLLDPSALPYRAEPSLVNEMIREFLDKVESQGSGFRELQGLPRRDAVAYHAINVMQLSIATGLNSGLGRREGYGLGLVSFLRNQEGVAGFLLEHRHIFAKAIRVAEVYERLVRPFDGWPAVSPREAMRAILLKTREGLFDKLVVAGLLKSLSLYPVGTLVNLSGGITGRVIAANPGNVFRPVVEVLSAAGPRILDLSLHPRIRIRSCRKSARLPVKL